MSDKKKKKININKEDVKVIDKKIVIDSPEIAKAIEDESFDVEYSEKKYGVTIPTIVT